MATADDHTRSEITHRTGAAWVALARTTGHVATGHLLSPANTCPAPKKLHNCRHLPHLLIKGKSPSAIRQFDTQTENSWTTHFKIRKKIHDFTNKNRKNSFLHISIKMTPFIIYCMLD